MTENFLGTFVAGEMQMSFQSVAFLSYQVVFCAVFNKNCGRI